jgi:hypothetical protein
MVAGPTLGLMVELMVELLVEGFLHTK